VAADLQPETTASRKRVRCACGNCLWHLTDRLETKVRPRGGQVRTIRLSGEAMEALRTISGGLSVICERCGGEWEYAPLQGRDGGLV